MSEIAIYLKIFGLGVDEHGAKTWGYAKLGLEGVPKDGVRYEDITSQLDLKELAKVFHCAEKDIVVITKEEYECETEPEN